MALDISNEEYRVLLYIANIVDESGFTTIDLERAEKILGLEKSKIMNILRKFEKNGVIELVRHIEDLHENSIDKIIKTIELFLENRRIDNPYVKELLLIHKNIGTRNAFINIVNSIIPRSNENQPSHKLALREMLKETIVRDSYANILRIKLQANMEKFTENVLTGIEWIRNPVYKNPLLIKLYNNIVVNALISLEQYTVLLAPLIRRALIGIDPSKTVFGDSITELNLPIDKLYIADKARLKIIIDNYDNRIKTVKNMLKTSDLEDELKTLLFQLYISLLIEKSALEKYSYILEKILGI